MIDLTLLKNILIVSVASSIISTALTQRLKEGTKCKNHICLKCLIISMVIGVLFSLTFTNLSIIETNIKDKYVSMNIRYLVHPKKKRNVINEINNQLLKLNEEGKISLYIEK